MPVAELDYELVANKVRLCPNHGIEQWFLLNMNNARFVYNFFLQVQVEWYRYLEPAKAKLAKKFEVTRKPRKLTKQQKLTRERNQKAIAKLIQVHKRTGKRSMSHFDMNRLLTVLKNMEGFEWLYAGDNPVLQQSLKDLATAFTNFYKGCGRFPRFHKRGNRDSFRFSQRMRLDVLGNGGLQLPGVPTVDRWVRCHGLREDLLLTHKTIQSVTVSLDAGKWYGSILARVPVHKKTEFNFPHEICGVDVGVVQPVTVSYGDGTHEVFGKEFNERLKLKELKVIRYQKKLARRESGSRNYVKAKVKLQRAHQRVRFARQDFVEQTSHRLAQCKVVCFEDTQIKNMTRSAKGTVAVPGKNVAAKSGLNKALLRVGIGKLKVRTEQKLLKRGGEFRKVPAPHTSQMCSQCYLIDKRNRKSQAVFHCLNPLCNHTANADDNASDCMIAVGTGTARPWRLKPRTFKINYHLKPKNTVGSAGCAC
jgi:putative transposase